MPNQTNFLSSTEQMLVERLQQNDKDAFLILFKKYNQLVFNWSLHFVKLPHIAEDIVQDVFGKIWEKRNSLNPQLSFPAYLYRIARNRAFTEIKKISFDEKLSSELLYQISISKKNSDYELVWKQYTQELKKVIQQLPKQQKEVFTRCREEGKTYEQVAAELGISRNTVKEHMVTAIKNIKKHFLQNQEFTLLLVLFLKNI